MKVENAINEFDNENKNYIKGFIGSLIGGLVCSIPWILVQVFLHTVAAVLGVLIGLGALKSYTLFKGKFGKLTRWIIAFSVFFSVTIVELIILWIVLLQNKIPLTLENYKAFFTDKVVFSSVKSNFELALFMALLGIISIFLNIKGSGKSIMPTIKK